MPTAFKKITSSQWAAEVPCRWLGPCALEIADGQTNGIIARSKGEASCGVARFAIPPLASGLVRVTVKQGEQLSTGLCKVPPLDNEPSSREEEVVIPLATISQAMPGVLVEDLKRRIANGDLAVSEQSPMFAAVSEHVADATSCRLTNIGRDGSFRFVCEVQA